MVATNVNRQTLAPIGEKRQIREGLGTKGLLGRIGWFGFFCFLFLDRSSASYDLDQAGGCGCRAVSARDERAGAFTLALGLGLAGLLVRRRRR